MKSTKVEVEGGELMLQSKEGHYAIIPAKHRQEVIDMVKEGCDDCINNYIQSLPKHSDYAEDGTVIQNPITKPVFDEWYKTVPEHKNDTSNYDLRAAYNNLPYETMNKFAASNSHLPDTYKKANHPTFSNESIYSNDSTPGGKWSKGKDDKWQFEASQYNVDNMGDTTKYKEWFKQNEPDATLVLPKTADSEYSRYIIQKNDTLSNLANTNNATVDELVKLNNIKDPNKIYYNKSLKIPYKYDKPLTQSNIVQEHHPNRIIDNYSKNYNYIVQGDKVYYSKKGKDYWVDISDNYKAKKNLYTFLNNKYKMRGYSNKEKEILQNIQNDTYNYKKPVLEDNNSINTNNSNNSDNDFNIKFYKDKFDNLPPNDKTRYLKERREINKLAFNTSPKEIGELLTSGKYNEPGNKKVEDNSLLGKFKDMINSNGDLKGLLEAYNNDDKSVIDLIESGIKRTYDKLFPEDEYISEYINSSITNDSKYELENPDVEGVKHKYGDDLYYAPRVMDLNKFKFKYRNEGDFTEIDNTKGSTARLFHPFVKASNVKDDDKFSTYIGINKDGSLKIGNRASFNDNDNISKTSSNKVYDFAKDKNGNIIFKQSAKNKRYDSPVTNVINDDGTKGQGSLSLLSYHGSKGIDKYQSVQGGSVILKVGEDIQLVTGSVRDVVNRFEYMKKKHNVDYVTIVNLDNGSYIKGLKTDKGKLTKKDLYNYDNRNASGGTFLSVLYKTQKDKPTGDTTLFNQYIKGVYSNKQVSTFYKKKFGNDYKEIIAKMNTQAKVYKGKFPEYTIPTSSVRDSSDRSFKLGHPLINKDNVIVFHHTAFMGEDLTKVILDLTDRKKENSSHVLIGYDGTRVKFANPEEVTFHAGASRYKGVDNVNDFGIGIEFQGNTLIKPLTKAQIQSAIEYITPILKDKKIILENLTTHASIRAKFIAAHPELKSVKTKPDITQDEFSKIIKVLLKENIYVPKYKPTYTK